MPVQNAFRFLLVLTGLLILFGSNDLQARQETTNLRGQIVTYNAYVGAYVPVPNVSVAILYYDSYYQKWRVLVSTSTDNYGMYYFYNINPGEYYLTSTINTPMH